MAISKKKSPKIIIILFLVLGLIGLIAFAIMSGTLSKFVPGLGQTTIEYWGLWESDSVIRPVLDEFQKAHPDILVNYTMQSPQEYRERLQSALSQNKGPDVFRIHNTWVPMFKADLDAVPDTVFSVADFEKTYYPAANTILRSGNSYLGIPLEYDGVAMFVNNDILNRHGLTVPQNWEELRNSAVIMTECASDDGTCKNAAKIVVSGAALGSPENVDHWQDIISLLMLQNNVTLNQLASPTTKPAEDVLEYFSSFSQSLGIWDSNLPSSTTLFAGGKVGIYFGPSWRVFDIKSLNPNLNFSVFPVPQLPVDPARGETPVSYASFWVEVVNKKSPKNKAAWELLKYLSSAEVSQSLYNQAISSGRDFGEPYARKDIVDSMQEPAKTFASQGLISKSWYLASFTHDGTTGINTKLSDLFAKALNRTLTVPVLATEVNKVLSEYGLAAPSQPQ